MADQQNSSYHIEQERRANDLLRVYNPTNEDYVVVWDKRTGGKVFRVKANSEEVLFRYIAEKYIKEMFQKILNEKVDKAVLKENEGRVAKGMAEMTKFAEQYRFEAPLLRLTIDDARKIIAILFVGLDREYGVDPEASAEEPQIEDKPVFEAALEDVQAGRVPTQSGVKTYKCDFPGCGKEFDKNIGLLGHKRSHRESAATIIGGPDTVKDASIDQKKQEATAGVSQ